MDIDAPTPLLGGLSPQTFMRRHWQRRPLLVRQAFPGGLPLIDRRALFALAARDDVESRLVRRAHDGRWRLRHGPMPRLPPLREPHWTLLVQGLDLHVAAAHELLLGFRFVPDARLDDVMLSYASDGGGVGPHVDSYDVFLLQTEGRRRWRVSHQRELGCVPDLPLKILRCFEPEREWLLEPGDMLYLPPGWAHDGIAEGACMTASIGFRAPRRAALARDVLQRWLDAAEADEEGPLYRDAGVAATREPARLPAALAAYAQDAVTRLLAEPGGVACALGESLTEPKPHVVFEAAMFAGMPGGVRLDRRSRMMYDDDFVFINGESFRATGRDGRLLRRLADRRGLNARELALLGDSARDGVLDWVAAGWLQATDDGGFDG
ncbi:MAG: cupin domain-containing protein [Proteobacteria bacterium]|nr:cupin domain-containing protein [Pseudomonadota bacterium]